MVGVTFIRPGGAQAAAAPAAEGGSLLGSGSLSTFGLVTAAAGALTSAIGTYYSTLSQRYSLRSQANDLLFQGSIADINARAAERDEALLRLAGMLHWNS